MRNNPESTIETLTEQLHQLRIHQREIDRNITSIQQQLETISDTASNNTKINVIEHRHIGRKCKVLNPHAHQPSVRTIAGFTKGTRPFVKVKKRGYVEIRRLPKNLELLPKDFKQGKNSETR